SPAPTASALAIFSHVLRHLTSARFPYTTLFRSADSAAATGFSESFGSRPLGRPKWASRMTLPPLVAISLMVGATRSSRVVSVTRSEEHTSELQSHLNLVCRLLLEKKKKDTKKDT